MDIKKENEILRKRNASLSAALEDAKKEIDRLKELSSDKEQDVILQNLKSIEAEWKLTVEDLKKQREKYIALNHELREIKKIFRKQKGM